MVEIDPISLEIMWRRLIAIADEAAATLLRTSFSTVVHQSHDFSCALFDSRGWSLAEDTVGIPSFNGCMPKVLGHLMRAFPPREWRPGDVGITNDPWMASGHLPDVAIVTPVFYRGKLVAWSASIAHKSDIGGSIWAADTSEVYEEGLRIPPMKLFRAGSENQDLFTILRANVRLEEQVVGDIMAQVAAGQVAGERISELLEEYEIDTLDEVAAEIQSRAEGAMRSAIRQIPDGVYRDEIETDAVAGESVVLRASVEVCGDEIHVDYEGSSPQVNSALNSVLNYTEAYTCYPIKCALDPQSPRNDGSYRPIQVSAPLGSVLNPVHPAAVDARTLIGHYLPSLIYGALVQVIPNRVISDSGSGPALITVISGVHGEEHERYGAFLFLNGGMGAGHRKDGVSCVCFPSTVLSGSIEILEATAPLRVWKRELTTDSGGPGMMRGGLGQDLEVELLADRPAVLSLFVDRTAHPARGFCEGLAGSASQVRINGESSGIQLKGRNRLRPGDRLFIHYPGGGGFGPPLRRTREAVARDLEDDRVSLAAAHQIYAYQEA